MEETTSSWSQRRKAVYLWSTILVLTIVSTLSFFIFWYEAPTCFDGFPNGDETGVDCGGSCSLICPLDALPPVMRSDPRLFQIYPNTYSAVVLVENRNIDSRTSDTPYVFKLYDKAGKLITERHGVADLAKNSTTAVFEGNIIATTTPSRVTFEFVGNITWNKDNKLLPETKLVHSAILNEEIAPRIDASIENNSLDLLKDIEIVVVVLDGRDNIIATSRTFVDKLNKGEKSNLFFTWPKPFSLGERACSKPSVVSLLLDRSGSMASISKNPPEPLTQVKNSAISFLNTLRVGDKVGLVSFSGFASDPPDSSLTGDFSSVERAINNMFIATSSTQYTNIADAIKIARGNLELESDPKFSKVIILLTDGIANRPKSPKPNSTEAEDIVNAEAVAESEAIKAKEADISIFTIGLGNDVHQDFLRKIASSPSEFFSAPTAADLGKIYNKISTSICKEVPAKIEMFVNIR